MSNKVSISEQEYKMLWGHLKAAYSILNKMDSEFRSGRVATPKRTKKRTTINDYSKLIDLRESKKIVK